MFSRSDGTVQFSATQLSYAWTLAQVKSILKDETYIGNSVHNKLEKTLGIRTFWDIQQNQDKHSDENWQDEMMKLEMRVSKIEEFRRVAFFHHLFLRKGNDMGFCKG